MMMPFKKTKFLENLTNNKPFLPPSAFFFHFHEKNKNQ